MLAGKDDFIRIVLDNPIDATLLDRLPEVGLPDCYVVAGCLFQTIWNDVSGFPPTHGILDYDVFYFDDTDLNWEAEDVVIRRCAEVFSDLDAQVEVRNQARVHLWYPEKYGVPCPPLRSSRDGVDGFLNTSSCFGVRRTLDRDVDVYAPFGFDDVFAMIVRPNRRREAPAVYHDKAQRWRRTWPELTIIPWETGHQATSDG